MYLHECPRENYIPIYLIVVGAFGLMLSLLSCLPCAQQPTDGATNPLNRACVAWNSLTSFFLFCWFIAGELIIFWLVLSLLTFFVFLCYMLSVCYTVAYTFIIFHFHFKFRTLCKSKYILFYFRFCSFSAVSFISFLANRYLLLTKI